MLESNPENNIETTDAEKPSANNFFISTILIFVVFVIAFSGTVFSKNLSADNIKETEFQGGSPAFEQDDNIEKILLIGIDQVAGQPSRADVIILAVINKDKSQVQLLSIPRDTRAAIPGHRTEKINHAQAYGGSALLAETVSILLDTNVDKYILLNFAGFKEVINIMGGLEYNVEMHMYYPDEGIDLNPGLQHLDGDKALQYVRYRSDGRGDIGRVGRQQQFIATFVEQKMQLKIILKVPELIAETYRSIKTNISLKDLVSIGLSMKNLESDELNTQILPGEAKYINGVSYWIAEPFTLEEILTSGESF